MSELRRLFCGFTVFLIVVFPVGAADPRSRSTDAPSDSSEQQVYEHAVVAADHPLASQAGVEILHKGGNVVDAAVAVSLALSVVRPESSGLGGGGFMLIWDADKQRAVALDYRERAPQKATRTMYLDPENPDRADPERSRRGHLAVAVPGEVAGLCYAVTHYGTLDLKTVMAPALRLARAGVLVDEQYRGTQRSMLEAFEKNPGYRKRFGPLYEKYLNSGKPWKQDDRFFSPQLRVLELIAEQGADGFYRGPVAEAIVAEMQRGGGLMTLADLAAAKPVVRKPLEGRFDKLNVLGMPPPSSGGVAIIETLNILSAYEGRPAEETGLSSPAHRIESLGHNSPAYIHVLAEAMKHAFADRAEFLGDADFADVPVQTLISRKYASRLAARIDPQHTQPLKSYGRGLTADDGGTSHFSIIDANGNAVACTETINLVFGSLVVEPEYGIVLNDQMDDFSAQPGRANAFGLIQSEANAIQPGKKPLSSMSPTIFVQDGKAVSALGASGGPRIISTTLQVLLDLTRFHLSPQEALRQPRFHHQWYPDVLFMEEGLFDKTADALKQRGHAVQLRSKLAACQAAWRSSSGLQGGSDPRKHGRPAGF